MLVVAVADREFCGECPCLVFVDFNGVHGYSVRIGPQVFYDPGACE